MKKYLSFILLILTLSSFTFLKADQPEDRYVGIWTVHLGNDLQGKASDVDYVDTFKFELNPKGKLILSCINYEYFVFSKIKPEKSSIHFLVENTEVPNEKFFINYSLKCENENLLKGTMHNSKGHTYYVELKRFK